MRFESAGESRVADFRRILTAGAHRMWPPIARARREQTVDVRLKAAVPRKGPTVGCQSHTSVSNSTRQTLGQQPLDPLVSSPHLEILLYNTNMIASVSTKAVAVASAPRIRCGAPQLPSVPDSAYPETAFSCANCLRTQGTAHQVYSSVHPVAVLLLHCVQCVKRNSACCNRFRWVTQHGRRHAGPVPAVSLLQR